MVLFHVKQSAAVIASEAKQSSFGQELDCFVAKAPRNDGNLALEVAVPWKNRSMSS
jgi:hypothetical protein